MTPMSLENLPAPGERHPEADNDDYWRDKLDQETFRILRHQGTERACSGAYWDTKSEGLYCCAGCGMPLYRSGTKFDSGTGWPSFNDPVRADLVSEHRDVSHGMIRTEIRCAYCNGHLGHVFDDGPPPTGKRHCVNSASLKFFPNKPDDA